MANPRIILYFFVIIAAIFIKFESSCHSGEDKWVQVNIPSSGTINAIEVDNSGIIYVGSVNGAFRSSDSGKTWKPINTGLDTEEEVIFLITGNKEGELYALQSYNCRLFFSNNYGESWNNVLLEYTDKYNSEHHGYTNFGDKIAKMTSDDNSYVLLFISTDEGMFRYSSKTNEVFHLESVNRAFGSFAVDNNYKLVYRLYDSKTIYKLRLWCFLAVQKCHI